MNIFIRAIFIVFLVWGQVSFALAQTAALLPNAVSQFFDNNGNPLTSGKVTTYFPGTSNLKTTWKDSAETIVNTNPIALDAGGKAIIYGEGTYRQVVKDRNNNLIWDAVTAPGGGGGSTPTTVGDGNMVGTILPWSNFVIPPQYVLAYGQEITRLGFPEFLAAITSIQAVFCTSGSPTLTGLSDTTQLPIGAKVEVGCIPTSAAIISKTTNSLTLDTNANISTNLNATIFPYGNGNGTTTFNVQDFRGQTLVGRNNMGNIASTNLTLTYFGVDPNAIGIKGGNQSYTLLQSNLPNIVPIFTGTPVAGVITDVGGGILGSSGVLAANSGTGFSGNVITPTVTTTAQGTISSINGNVTQTAFSRIQPSFSTNYIVKITPDTSSSIATGVASLGGMNGVIICGTGLNCSSNTISVNTGIFSNQAANVVLAGPASGSAALPAFRSLVLADLPSGSRAGTVYVNSIGTGIYTAYAPDGTVICTTSTTKCFQEGISYATTNHLNFKANCAENDTFLSFTAPLSFGPGTSIFYDLTGCSVAFSGFTGDAIKIDTLNQGSHLKWTSGYITSTATGGSAVVTFNPHTTAPGSGTAFQGSRVDLPYVLAGASVSRGVVFFEAITSTYSIANGNIFTFSLIDGNAGGFFAPACIVVENTPNSNNAFVQNIIDFTSCQNPATTGIKIGTTTPTGPIGTNIWRGMIGIGHATTFGIETFGQLDQFYLSSVSVNAGSLTTGIIFRSGANHNYIIAPQMEGTLDVNDGGTGNCGVINAQQKSCGSSW